MRTRDRPVLLPRALASVAAQHFDDWHLYVVNDGGDPALVERVVAARAESLSGRLTMLHHPVGLGMEAASNRAMEAARGEFIVVHDDDDSWHPNFLTRTVAFLRDAANIRFIGVVTDSQIVWERIEGGTVIEEARGPLPFFSPNIELRRVLAGNIFPPISLLLRRAAAQRVGAFNADLPVLGDWEFNLRALALGDFGVVEEALAFYHQRRGVADPAYANSVIADTRTHQQYDTLLRNSVIRLALRDNPALIGVIQPLLHAAGEQAAAIHDEFDLARRTLDQRVASLHTQFDLTRRTTDQQAADLHARLGGIEASLAEIRHVAVWLRKMLAPLQWIWFRLLPVRQTLGRRRKRVP